MSQPTQLDRHWEPDDVLGLPDDGNRYEIVDGRLRVSPSPSWRHNRVAFEVGVQLQRVVPSGLSVVVPGGSIVTPQAYLLPDLAVVEAAQAVQPGHRAALAGVRLVLEVASPSSALDNVLDKAELYAEAAIASYWRVELDPEPVLIVTELRGGRYVEVVRGKTVTVRQPYPVTVSL